MEIDSSHPPAKVHAPGNADNGSEVYLDWEQTLDDEGYLRRCPVCGCRELFVRKDFPQVTGFVIVVLAAVLSLVLMGFNQMIAALILLVTLIVVDALIFLFARKCLICYRCRSEYRNLPIRPRQPGWDMALSEKYRSADTPAQPSPPNKT